MALGVVASPETQILRIKTSSKVTRRQQGWLNTQQGYYAARALSAAILARHTTPPRPGKGRTMDSLMTEHQPDKQRVLNRLRRLEGQIRGLQKMVDEERPCQDILTLLSGIRSALDATGDAIFEEYINSCVMEEGVPLSPKDIVRTARLLR